MENADPASHRAQCTCGYKLWDRRRGEWSLVARVLKLRDDGSFEAKCPECRADVPIGFLTLRGSETNSTAPRFVVRVDSIPRP